MVLPTPKAHKDALSGNYEAKRRRIRFITATLQKDKDVIDAAISSYPDVVMELADEQLTEERLHRALELDNTLLHRLPDEILDRFGIEQPANVAQAKDTASSLPEIRAVELELPEVPGTAMATTASALPVLYDLTAGDNIPNIGKFFYITDLHLESQLGLTGMTVDEIKGKVAQKVDEMLSGISKEDMSDGVLLVGGDVADSEEVAKIFFDTVFFRFADLSFSSLAIMSCGMAVPTQMANLVKSGQ